MSFTNLAPFPGSSYFFELPEVHSLLRLRVKELDIMEELGGEAGLSNATPELTHDQLFPYVFVPRDAVPSMENGEVLFWVHQEVDSPEWRD